MNGESLVTIYRSADPSAREQAQEARDILAEAGLNPEVFDDRAPGVPSGAWEVRVPTAEAEKADQLIEAAGEPAAEGGDPSHDLDVETIFSAIGATAEVEALGILGVLEANGIPTMYVSPPQYPNLRFVVRVPKKFIAQARQVLEEAELAGRQAAETAELESELGPEAAETDSD